MPTLYIIDGHSQVFKAYHAIQNLSTSKGVPVNAVFGFIQIINKLMKTRTPEYVMVTFDSGGATFRHDMYSEYKANRDEAPEDFALQMKYILTVLEGMRIPVIQKQGFEADDLIATIAKKAEAEGFDVVVVTADKDLFQLVNEHVRILRLDPDKEIEFDREGVKAKMGVYPEQVGDYLAIVGDTSDNVPGIKGVGPKGATALLEQFGSLEGVLVNTDKLKGKQKENIEAGIESARLSRKLVSLDEQVPVPINLEAFRTQSPDPAILAPLYKELEFRRFYEEVQGPPEERKTNYRLVTTKAELEAFAREISAAGTVALDTETDSLSTITAKLAGLSMSVRPNEAVYVPVGHVGPMGGEITQLSLDDVVAIIGPLFKDPSVRKIAHNMKFDLKILRRHGLALDSIASDTLLASYLVNPDKRNHGLKDLANDLLGIKMTRIDELIGSGKNEIKFTDVDPVKACDYAAADADITLQLATLLEKSLNETGMRDMFERIELPLIEVLIGMEETGVCINADVFKKLATEMTVQLEQLRKRMVELVGREFNPSSPKQVGQVLFEDLGLKPGKSKKTGYSTDVEVLEELGQFHEVPRLMAEYRQFEKLKSTYVDVLPGLVVPVTGRIHTSYNQAVAATGRLSSTDPNLQNIPVRTELGRGIRGGFIPSDPVNNVLLSADYSQIELRVLAHVSKDPGLVKAFAEDVDIHTLTASKVFGMSPEMVTDEMRDQSKAINFGIIYGMSAHGLSQRLKIPMASARTFIEEYFKAYAGVRAWLDATLEQARTQGFVSTVSGRRRYLADINSKNFNARAAAERIAVNAPIQGTSADMIKIAMINVHRELKKRALRTAMIMQVHDELIFDTPMQELDEVKSLVQDLMQSALPLDVPVRVGLHSGKNWAEC